MMNIQSGPRAIFFGVFCLTLIFGVIGEGDKSSEIKGINKAVDDNRDNVNVASSKIDNDQSGVKSTYEEAHAEVGKDPDFTGAATSDKQSATVTGAGGVKKSEDTSSSRTMGNSHNNVKDDDTKTSPAERFTQEDVKSDKLINTADIRDQTDVLEDKTDFITDDESDAMKFVSKVMQDHLNVINIDVNDVLQKGEIEEVPLPEEEGEEDASKMDSQEDPLTEEELKGKELFEEAIKLRNQDNDKARYNDLLEKASNLKYIKAQEEFAMMQLLVKPEQLKNTRILLEELNIRGSPVGQLGLGFLHAVGIGYNSSQAKALIYYTFAGLGGNSYAQMALAYKHWAGVGVPSACEPALTYYRKVANKVAEDVSVTGGTAIQRVRLEDEIENPGSSTGILDDDLLQYYKFLADKGDIPAQVGLGQLYYQGGRGVLQDHERALSYFLNAADNGNPNAMAFLGKMYLEGGSVVKQDNETALKYFKNAAEKDNPVGQSGLGLMYLYGKGVDKDYQKAFKYFALAADQGWVDGQLQLGNMFYSGLGVRKDIKMAIKYFNMASQSGHVLAFYNLAQIHASGTGVVRSCQTAVELFKNVAERGKWGNIFMDAYLNYRDGKIDHALIKYMLLAEMGYEVAQSNAAFILDRFESSRFGINETYARALLLYGRSASQGNSASRLKLGDYHYYGHGTNVDYETSVTHYKIAAEQQHNAQAMFNLGYMHEQGFGLRQDLYLAKRFYDMAAETSVDAQVPVNLALMKLNFLFMMKNFEEFNWNDFVGFDFNFDHILGPDWDLYLMTTLAIILGIIVYFRRPAQQ